MATKVQKITAYQLTDGTIVGNADEAIQRQFALDIRENLNYWFQRQDFVSYGNVDTTVDNVLDAMLSDRLGLIKALTNDQN